MTEPKPRATAQIDVISRGKASIQITTEDGKHDAVGEIVREGDHHYRVEDADGRLVTHVQQYRRAGRALAAHYGILPRYTLRTDVDHPR